MNIAPATLAYIDFQLWLQDAILCWKQGRPTPDMKLDMQHLMNHPLIKELEQ
jgi:hypothetical protein